MTDQPQPPPSPDAKKQPEEKAPYNNGAMNGVSTPGQLPPPTPHGYDPIRSRF